jgi:capsular polysaccharide biosynthesis protein
MREESEFTYQEGVELGYYIEVMLRRWYMIVLPAALAVLVVAGYLLLRPPRYEARAVIVALKSTAQVSYDTAIQTFVGLANSPDIARAVLAEMGDRLSAENREIEALFDMVEARLVPRSDLIEITVTHPNAEVAAGIADIWAREYVERVNRLYGDESYTIVQKEVSAARMAYEQAQADLETILEQDRQGELQRRIDELAGIIDTMSMARLDNVYGLLLRLQRTEALLQSAQDMAEQLRVGGSGAALSNSIALNALKLQVFGELQHVQSPLLPASQLQAEAQPLVIELQAESNPAGLDEMIADVESLIDVLQARRQTLVAQLNDNTEILQRGEMWALVPDGVDYQPTAAEADVADRGMAQITADLEQQMRQLMAAATREQSRLDQATVRRDLALETYTNLVRKETELQLAIAASGAELRLGMPSVGLPAKRNLVQNGVLAALVGGIPGIFAIFALEYWRRYKGRTSIVEAADPDDR